MRKKFIVILTWLLVLIVSIGCTNNKKISSEDTEENINNGGYVEEIITVSDDLNYIVDITKLDNGDLIVWGQDNDLKEKVSSYHSQVNNYSVENSELKENEIKLKEIVKFKEAELEEFKVSNTQQILEEKNSFEKKIATLESELKDALSKKETYRLRNKDINFQLQNYKYKVLDLEKKLMDSQFKLAVEKRDKNPLLR